MASRRSRKYLLLVAGGLLIPALLLCLLGVKLLDDFTGVARGIRSEYGAYMAGLAARAIEDAVWEREQLSMVAARLDPPEDPNAIGGFLRVFRAENPYYRFGFFVTPVGLTDYTLPVNQPNEPLRPLPDWVLNPILASMNRHQNIPSGVLHLTAPDSLPRTQVTYFTVHSATGELVGAAGFAWDLERWKADQLFLERVLVRDLGANEDVFQGSFLELRATLSLLDEHGAPYYATSPQAQGDIIGSRHFSRVFPFYQVAVRLQDDKFDNWVQTVIWTNLAIIVSMFLVIVLAAAFSLRFILREVELADMKSTFVSNVSHELKTPLALIRLYAETLELGRAGSREKEQEFLRIINTESERLTHLINNILDMGRIDQNRKRYDIQPTDLSAAVRDTLDAYHFQLARDGFQVESEIADDLTAVPADRDAITQALLNLMENAIKYSDEQKFLRVSLRRDDAHAIIEVEDRGCGIPKEDRERVFEKFYRVEHGLVHNVKGSGLGLALVKHIADAHQGRIEITDAPGRGSRFILRIPLGS